MNVIVVGTGKRKVAFVNPVEDEDLPAITRKRFFFDWKSIRSRAALFKLQIKGEDEIQGLMALTDFPLEERIQIELLASARPNIGICKVYDRVAGCLISFACYLAVMKYGVNACVSLFPKTELAPYYMRKYHMLQAGRQLYLDGAALLRMLNEYYE